MKFTFKPTLSNETVTLRPFREEDIPAMLEMLTMPN